MRVLILGASGFLGSHIYRYMEESGYHVESISYRPGEDDEFIGNLKKVINSFNPEVILNTGASQNNKDDPESMRELSSSNILLPSYLAWAINNYTPNCLLITFGTSWQFNNKEYLPYNAYAATKHAAEAMMKHYSQDGLRVASLLLHDTYGLNDTRKKIVNLLANSLIYRKRLNMSGGEQEIDLIHIEDVIRAIMLVIKLLKKQNSGCLMKYAVCSGKPLKIKELAEIMSNIDNQDVAKVCNFGFYPYHKRERFKLNTQLETIPGWKPKKDLINGLKELINEHNEHKI